MRTESRVGSTPGARAPLDPLDARKLALHLLELASKDASPETILAGAGDARMMRARLLATVYPREASLSKDDQTLLTRATVVVTSAYDALTKRDAKSTKAYGEACRWARDDLQWARTYVSLSKTATKALVALHIDAYETAPLSTVVAPQRGVVTEARQTLMTEALIAGASVCTGGPLSIAELLQQANPAYAQGLRRAEAASRRLVSLAV